MRVRMEWLLMIGRHFDWINWSLSLLKEHVELWTDRPYSGFVMSLSCENLVIELYMLDDYYLQDLSILQNSTFAPNLCLRVTYVCDNKQRLLPQTTLKDPSVLLRSGALLYSVTENINDRSLL
jgi:hypothetical protein